MSIAVLIKQLRDAGAPMEAIEIAVSAVEAERARFEAAEAARAAVEEARKADQRERTARSRARTAASRDGNVTVTTKSRDPSPNERNLTPTHENSPSDPNGSSAPKGADQAEGDASDDGSPKAGGAKRARKARKHFCPAGFAPKDRHYPIAENRGYSRDFVDREAIKMHRWSNSAGRPSCTKSDWDLAFDNWLERAMDDIDSRPHPPRTPPGIINRTSARDDWAADAIASHESLMRKRDEQRGFSFDEDQSSGADDQRWRDASEGIRERSTGELVVLQHHGNAGRRRALG